MPLSDRLRDVELTFNCPRCGHPLVKPGRWFKSSNRFKCKACQENVRLSYSTKVALFARHNNLADSAFPAGDELHYAATKGQRDDL